MTIITKKLTFLNLAAFPSICGTVRRLQSRTKVDQEKNFELQYADDCVVRILVCHSAGDLQEAIDVLFSIYNSLGLVINTSKTEVMFQWTGGAPQVEPAISAGGSVLTTSAHFNYLGSMLSVDCTGDEEINRTLNKACSSFGRIRKQVVLNHNLRLNTKVSVYRAVCASSF